MSDHNTDRGANGTPLDADAFWNFASALYGRAEVAAACLHLQDTCGARVNLLLLGLWLADQGLRPIDPQLLASGGDDWHHRLVMPLRSLRRSLKADAAKDEAVADLRRDLLAAELKAERIEQARLIAQTRSQADSSKAWLTPVLIAWAGATADADVKAVHDLVTALGHLETKTK